MTPTLPPERIRMPVAELVDRHVYVVSARNFDLGVYTARDQAIIGIREKFGERYLASEYPHDPLVSSTVTVWKDTGVVVPPHIPLRELLVGTTCSAHDRDAHFIHTTTTRGYWEHLDNGTTLDEDDHPLAIPNRELFDYLDRLTPHYEVEP